MTVALLAQLNLRAQDATPLTLHVEEAGTLSTLIEPDRKDEITNLTLTGNLNGTDIRYIREMAGRTTEDKATEGKLTILNLADANIVRGGDFYWGSTYGSKLYANNDSIGKYMFMNTELTAITLPNSLTLIATSGFEGCAALKSITIPNGVTSIVNSAFKDCTALTSVAMGSGVTTIGNAVFKNCTALTDVTIGSSVGIIEFSAFEGCTALTGITIPNGVTSIKYSAFEGCTGLTSIAIPNSVTLIGNSAFEGCSALTNIMIGSGVTSIGATVFQGCTVLKEIMVAEGNTKYSSLDGVLFEKGNTILKAYPNAKSQTYAVPDGVTTIGNSAFRHCPGITSIAMGSSVTTIESSAFRECTELKTVTLEEGVTSISSSAFEGCTALMSIAIPNSVTTLGTSAFKDCAALTAVTIGSGISTIAGSVFRNCASLTSVTIPANITSIGSSAFNGCEALKEIYCKSPEAIKVGSDAFKNVNKSACKLYVPKGAYDSYSQTTGWSDFANIIEEEETSINAPAQAAISVLTNEGVINIGVQRPTHISVYTVMGTMIYSGMVEERESIAVGNGVYVVKSGEERYKVVVRE